MREINDILNDSKIRIVLADDHSLVREGIKSLLEYEPNLEVVGEASDGEEAVQLVTKLEPDILIVDIRMPKMSGIEVADKLSKHKSLTRSIVLSMHDSKEYILKSVEAGAKGYLLKDTGREDFLKAIDTVYNGGTYFSAQISRVFVEKYLESLPGPGSAPLDTNAEAQDPQVNLTKRQLQIMALAISGLSNREIAEKLGKSVRTVETHRFSLMKKLGVRNLIELSIRAKEYEGIEGYSAD